MASYPKIQALVHARYGFWPKTCWIAHVKSYLGMTRGPAHNRLDPCYRLHPCPPSKWAAIEAVCRELGFVAMS